MNVLKLLKTTTTDITQTLATSFRKIEMTVTKGINELNPFLFSFVCSSSDVGQGFFVDHPQTVCRFDDTSSKSMEVNTCKRMLYERSLSELFGIRKSDFDFG